MNELEFYFNNNEGRLIQKWKHYFNIYEKHFEKFKNKEVIILEIGVSDGGSLQMWKKYFGEKAKIYGIDINPKCKQLEEKNIEIFIGSQSDRNFLRKIKTKIPKIDILIDDGGHTMKQQITAFEELFEYIKSDGVYLCEDTHTSYWLKFGGGYKRRGTFIEYSKHFIDAINAYHSEQKSFKVNSFTKTVNSIHYYDSILVIEKEQREEPLHLQSGRESFEHENLPSQMSPIKYKKYKLKIRILFFINSILQFFRLRGYKLR
jgi:23S rRNA U2552 (ribose-2'-O)-methylase RlmE/FtsJ